MEDNHIVDIKIIERYFIIAHRAVINTIQIMENTNVSPEKFIITASNDNNINLHRLKTGVLIGQFGQGDGCNIKDMTPYENKKPRYVREWYVKLRQRMKKMREKRLKDQTAQESAPHSTTQSPAK